MKKPKKAKIEVVTNKERTAGARVLEQELVGMAKAMNALVTTRLEREAIIALVSDSSRVNKTLVRAVIDCLANFETRFLKAVD